MFNLKLSKTMKDIQWSFISLATASFAHLLLRIVLGKALGPSGLGLYTLVFTIYMLGMQFAAFGIGIALTKYVAEYYNDLPKIQNFISSGILGSLISGSLMGVLMYLLSGFISLRLFHNPEMVALLELTSFCFPFISMQKAVIGTLNGLREMKLFAFVNILQHVSVMIVSIAFVLLLNMNVKGAVLGFVIPTIAVGLFSLVFTRKYFIFDPAVLITDLANLKELLWFGFYIVLANSIGLINTQIDSLMLGYFMNEVDVGYYAVAVIFVEGLKLIPDAVQKVTTPSIASYYGKRDYQKIINLVKSSMLKVFLITLILSFVLLGFGRLLIEILFSEEFLPAYYPLIILLLGCSIHAPVLSIAGTLPSIGKVALMSKLSFICAGMNTLLNILLIPKYGIIGAAIATSVSLIFTSLVKLYFIKVYIQKPA
jgi:O-antigen/teichoic acid export membrane protein